MSAAAPRLEELFEKALAIPAGEQRAKFLAAACGGDADLRQRLERLLRASQDAGSFLENAADPAPTLDQPPLEQPGAQIGPYKLLQEIGEGGMGVVYMAEQHAPVKRRVALKLVKPGMDSRQVVARFEAERQALALMDHPNIARVLDCGTTEHGRPYFVMELVKGVPITKYCDENHLTPRERLELFIPICQAIQHAHQKGIIHRDIKPSNILVAEYDQKPVPKIIDFGVAKALNAQLTDLTMFTQLGQVVGTLEYMSPEQSRVNQLDVDTRSDIYSLGVLLYELLTGATPFDRKRFRAAAFDEMLRIIREEEPPRPSTRLSTIDTLPSIAANRKTEPKKLSTLLRGELDWIVMKALEKDRARRYETATGFANDIQRYLSDEPVAACPPSAAYKFQKFARRNKVALATASLITAALFVGIIGTSWQAWRATRAENLAQLRLATETKALRETEVARNAEQEQRVLAEQLQRQAESAAQEARTESARSKAALDVLVQVLSGHSDSFPGARHLIDWNPSQSVYEMLISLSDLTRERSSLTPDVLAEVHGALATGFYDRDGDRAIWHAELAVQQCERFYGHRHVRYADALVQLAQLSWLWNGDTARVEQLVRDAISIYQVDPIQVNSILNAYAHLVSAYAAMGAHPQAEASTEEALQFARNHKSAEAIEVSGILQGVAWSRRARGEFDRAIEASTEALRIALAKPEGGVGIGWAAKDLAEAEQIAGRLSEAESHYRLAMEVYQKSRYDDWASECLTQLQRILASQQRLPEFQRLLEQTPELVAIGFHARQASTAIAGGKINDYAAACREMRRLGETSADPIALETIAFTCLLRAEQLVDLDAIIDMTARLVSIQSSQVKPWVMRGGLLVAAKRYGEALDALQQLESLAPFSGNGYYARSWQVLGGFYASNAQLAIGNIESAIDSFRRADAQWRALLNDPHAERRFSVDQFTRDQRALTDRIRALTLHQVLSTQVQAPNPGLELDPSLAPILSDAGESKRVHGELREALGLANRAIELDTASWLFYYRRGDIHANLGEHAQAIADYAKATELDPTQTWPWLNRGNCQQALGQLDQALESYAAALRLDPKNAAAYFQRSQLYVHQLKDFPAAFADASKYIELGPNNAGAWFHRGNTYMLAGDPAAAIADYDRGLQLAPGTVEVHHSRARALVAVGRLDDAVQDYRTALNLGHGDPAGIINQMLACYRSAGTLDRAAADVDKIERLDEGSPEHWHHRGLYLQLLGKYEEAIQEYTRAIDLGPSEHWALYWALLNRGLCRAQLGKRAEARADYLATRGLGKNDVHLAHNRALRLRDLGEHAEALVDFETALRIDPRFSGSYFERSILYAHQLKDYPAALADASKNIELDPNNAGAWFHRGNTYMLAGDPAAAIADYDRGLQLKPDDTGVLQSRAHALLKVGRLEDALAGYSKFLEIKPRHAGALHSRGQIYARLGKLSEALADFEAAETVEPKNQRHCLARLGVMASQPATAATAAEELERLLQESADPGKLIVYYGIELSYAGLLETLRAAVHRSTAFGEGTEGLMHYNLGCGYALAGDKDRAFAAIHRSNELGGARPDLMNDTDLISLRDDPRFAELSAQLKWREAFAAGRPKFQAGQNAEAIVDFTRAIELNPNFPVLYEWRGSAYRNSGQTKEADADWDRYLAFYQQAAEAEPENWVAWQRLAAAFSTLQRWDEALQAVAKATELAPEKPALRRIRADIQLALNRWGDAETELTRLIEKSAADWPLHYQRALARLAQDDRAGYRAACAAMLTAFAGTQDPVAANFAAWTCCLAPAAVDDWTAPLALARQATTAQPDSQQNQNTLGFVLLRAGKVDEAILELEAAAAKLAAGSAAGMTSPAAYTWFGLALAHQAAGHADQASSWYARAAGEAEKQLGEPSSAATPLPWNRRLTLELLQREAQAALGPKTPESPANTTPNE